VIDRAVVVAVLGLLTIGLLVPTAAADRPIREPLPPLSDTTGPELSGGGRWLLFGASTVATVELHQSLTAGGESDGESDSSSADV
jgi:hypothetical protein